jgi:hypothetical protein
VPRCLDVGSKYYIEELVRLLLVLELHFADRERWGGVIASIYMTRIDIQVLNCLNYDRAKPIPSSVYSDPRFNSNFAMALILRFELLHVEPRSKQPKR